MKFLIYFVLCLFSYFNAAHIISEEKIAQLKETTERLREQLRQVGDRRNLFCNESDSKSHNLSLEINTKLAWNEACKQSSDPEIVKARDHLNKTNAEFELFKASSQDYQLLQSLLDSSSPEEIAPSLGELEDDKKVMIIQAFQEKWVAASTPFHAKRVEAWSALYDGACKGSQDPQVSKAYRHYQDSRTNCSKATEHEIAARQNFDKALHVYNQAVRQSEEPMLNQRQPQPSSSGFR